MNLHRSQDCSDAPKPLLPGPFAGLGFGIGRVLSGAKGCQGHRGINGSKSGFGGERPFMPRKALYRPQRPNAQGCWGGGGFDDPTPAAARRALALGFEPAGWPPFVRHRTPSGIGSESRSRQHVPVLAARPHPYPSAGWNRFYVRKYKILGKLRANMSAVSSVHLRSKVFNGFFVRYEQSRCHSQSSHLRGADPCQF